MFYQGQIICCGLFNLLRSPTEIIGNASGSLSPGLTDHRGLTMFIFFINCHLPMGKKKESE